jgi:hypothetical protein
MRSSFFCSQPWLHPYSRLCPCRAGIEFLNAGISQSGI